MVRNSLPIIALLLTGAFASIQASAAQAAVSGESGDGLAYSPPLRTPPEKQLLWGDLHLHTSLSMDAYVNGTRLGQDEAYRFARGETIVADNGVPASLGRALDFLAITDHSENLGVYASIAADDPRLAGSDIASRWTGILELVGELGLRGAFRTAISTQGPLPELPQEVQLSNWQAVAERADRHNQPAVFTTLIGYEWTSMISGDNLHRVVLFRDDAALASKHLPANARHNPDPENLWASLEDYQRLGGRALAIAHNGNLSNGRMFSPERISGQAMDQAYAEARARWEPLYEVTQVKGDGESHPKLSPSDEFSDFENWDWSNVAETAPKEDWMLRYEYARSGLAEGLRHQQSLGVNPFKFGMIGGSDIHTGLSTTSEANFFGKFPDSSPSPLRFAPEEGSNRQRNRELGASGLTAVWAAENTREAIFDALQRREVYATTGTRIRLRFFGGWQFTENDIHRADYASHAYRTGVAMGGDLPQRAANRAPTFLIHAARDPQAAYLDRVQVIKGWIDSEGVTREKIFDVAMAGEGRKNAAGEVQPLVSTVDIASASYSNTIGAPELSTVWRDPEFDPAVAAFYYLRVLEIPTPRWTTYDAAFFGVDLPADTPATLQERAYSSPIWYRPSDGGATVHPQ